MYKSLLLISLGMTTAAVSAGLTQDIIVDFDDQIGGIPGVVTDGMFSDHVTFSTNDFHSMVIFAGAGVVGGTNPNSLTSVDVANGSLFNGDIYMDFTVAANNVSLDILADNEAGIIAGLLVSHSGGDSMVDVIGNGDFSDSVFMDLSSFMDITRIELVDITDEFGLGIDNLNFTVPVPTPNTLALLGFGALAGTRRRR
jgi:hypothetical protein